MNSITKSLTVLAMGGILSGMAFAGPNDAYAGQKVKGRKRQLPVDTLIPILMVS